MDKNARRGNRGSYICWQSIDNAGNRISYAELYVNSYGDVLVPVFNVYGSVRSWGATFSSSSNIKEKVRPRHRTEL
jgi:hypothetical protein